MSSDQKNDIPVPVPGVYFVGPPTNHAAAKTEEPPHAAAKTEEPPHAAAAAAAGEQNPATARPPGDYFIGPPEGHHKQQQQEAEAVQKQTTTKQSTPSFWAKCCPCLAGGGAKE